LPVASLASPALTGDWEARLARMARGEEPRAGFMRDIEAYVRRAVREIFDAPPGPRAGSADAATRDEAPIAPAGDASGEGRRASVDAPAATRGRPPPPNVTAPGSGFAPPPRQPSRAAPRPARPPAGPRDAPAGRAGGDGTTGAARARRVAAAAGRDGPTPEPLPPCPKCQRGAIIRGKRAWGCARWREGCALVIPFEREGKPITATQLRDLLARGKTRPATWTVAGAPAKGRLLLDLASSPPAVRFEAS
jgi:DNA topoisomerase-3